MAMQNTPAFAAPGGLSTATLRVRRRRPGGMCCPVCTSMSASGDSDPLANISQLGVGTWSWGNKILFGYSPSQDADLQAAFNTAVVRGVSLFDTADSYGTLALNARAEHLLGRFLRECPVPTHDVLIASKVASYPWRLTRRSVADAAARSAARLGRPVDLLQVHWSASRYAPWQERALWDGVADALQRGDCRAIGVSNFGPVQFARAFDYLLRERGARLAAAQMQLSLLSRAPLRPRGLLAAARARGVRFIGYSPLCLGLLAGGARRGRGALRDALFDRVLRGARPLQDELARVATARGRTQAQIAIAWCLSKGVIVLTGVRNERQAVEGVESLGVRLSEEEVMRLERAADACPRQMIENSFQTE